MCRVFPPGKPSKIPHERSLIHIDADNILLAIAKPSGEGNGIILHLRETKGRPADIRIYSDEIGKRGKLVEVNVLRETIGPSLQSIRMEAWESRFFLFEF